MNDTKRYENVVVLITVLVIFHLASGVHALLPIAAGVGFFSVAFKPFRVAVSAVFTKLTHFISMVVSNVALTLVYFLVLCPLAFLFRMMKGDVLGLKPNKNCKSYYEANERGFTAEELEKTW